MRQRWISVVLLLSAAGCDRTPVQSPKTDEYQDMRAWFAERDIQLPAERPEPAGKMSQERLLGDVTGNGTVSLYDLRMLWDYLTIRDVPPWVDLDLLDIDRDGDADWTDLKLLGEYVSNPEAGNLYGIGLVAERPFDIELVFRGSDFTQRHRALLNEAAAVWESIIVADLPDVAGYETDTREYDWWSEGDWQEVFGQIVNTKDVDDLCVYVGMKDLAEGIYGRGTAWGSRESGMPIDGLVTLSRDFLTTESDRSIVRVMVHEIGHVLGFGMTPWDDLLRNNQEGLDAYFSGTDARDAFLDAGGRYLLPGVPVQNRGDGWGSHWRESTLGAEIMTPEGDEDEALSAISIQALADLGYEVDVSRAEPYRVPPAGSAKVVASEPRWRCGVGP